MHIFVGWINFVICCHTYGIIEVLCSWKVVVQWFHFPYTILGSLSNSRLIIYVLNLSCFHEWGLSISALELYGTYKNYQTRNVQRHIFIAVQDMFKVSYDANHMIEWEKLRTGGCTRMRTIIIETADMSFKRSHCLILTSRWTSGFFLLIFYFSLDRA